MDNRTADTAPTVRQSEPDAPSTAGRTLRRRGLVASAAAFATLLVTNRADATNTAQTVVFYNGYTNGQDSHADAIQGYTRGGGNAGALGRNDDANGNGVTGVGVNGFGVVGESGNGTGVYGSGAIWGVHGVMTATTATAAGVFGEMVIVRA